MESCCRLALHIPVLAISAYARKIGDVMSLCGQADFHLEASEADLEQLKRAFQALEQNRHSIAQHLEYVVADLNASLEEQYQAVFGLLEHDRKDLSRRTNAVASEFRGLSIEDVVRTAAEHDKAGAACAE